MIIPLVPPFWLSVNVSRGPYSFCLNPHIGLFWTKQRYDKGASGVFVPVPRIFVSFIDKYRFPKTKDITIASSVEEIENRRDWYLASAKELDKLLERKKDKCLKHT